jgi:hypothetical protein
MDNTPAGTMISARFRQPDMLLHAHRSMGIAAILPSRILLAQNFL